MLDSLFSIAALVGGTVLGFQFVMMLLGLGHDGDGDIAGGDAGFDGDMDGSFEADSSLEHDATIAHHGTFWFYEVISIRTLSAALTFFGLSGMLLLEYGHSPAASFVYAALIGGCAMYTVYWLFKQVYKLQSAGNENVRRAIGLPATVYIPIPASRSGTGKVMFRLQDRTVEYLAVTNDSSRLATGEKVVIVGIVNSGTVRVARQVQEAPQQVSA